MICCRISTFPSQTTILVVYRSTNSNSSDGLLAIQAIRHVANAPGGCRIAGNFNAPVFDWSNRACPKSDGFDKTLSPLQRKFLNHSIPQPTRFQIGKRPSVFDLVLLEFPDTVPAIILLTPLGNSDHAPLSVTFDFHDSHEPTRPRAKWCYNEQMKAAVVEAAALLEWNDVSLARTVEDLCNLIKEQILCLRDRFANIHSRKGTNRSPWLKSRHKRARQLRRFVYQQYSQNPNQFALDVYQAES